MAVQDMMCREESMETVLRLMCLISLTQVGTLDALLIFPRA